jgi:hypothetical protein
MKGFATRACRHVTGAFARLLFLFPVFWILYGAGAALSFCPAVGPRRCLQGLMMSPFYAVFPPILDIADEALWSPTPHLAILLAAIVVAVVWEFVSLRKSRC